MPDRPPLDLDAIEKRCNAATPGPWLPACGTGWPEGLKAAMGVLIDERGPEGVGWPLFPEGEAIPDGAPVGAFADPKDQMFAAHARQDLPAVVAELREAREVIRELSDLLDEVSASGEEDRAVERARRLVGEG